MPTTQTGHYSDHYSDLYWNDIPRVQSHLCKLVTGDENVWWNRQLKDSYATPPRERGLVIACGNGWVERDLYDLQIAEHFDAFDPNPTYLEEARKLKGSRSIDYFQATFTDFPLDQKYDLIVNVAALHHARFLYRTVSRLSRALSPQGLLVSFDYVGPSRNQYSERQLELMIQANAALPERLRSPHRLRPPLKPMVEDDPTEAVHSAELLAAVEQYFDIIEQRDLGGGVAYQILWNNVEAFRDESDEEAQEELDRLLALDHKLTRNGEIPTLFTFFLARPRSRPPQLQAYLARWVKEPLREALSCTLLGDYYPREIFRRWRSHPRMR